MMKRSRAVTVVAVALSGILLAGCAARTTDVLDRADDLTATAVPAPRTTAAPAPGTTAAPESEATAFLHERLQYLIEEEKLAHDVYVALYELWGTRIFANIAASEITHEDAVAGLLSAYDVADPRSPEPGVFSDPALQAVYDDLLVRGSRSLSDAIAVGVAIETSDIADIGATLPAAPGDVAMVLERLLEASQNHLTAFEQRM